MDELSRRLPLLKEAMYRGETLLLYSKNRSVNLVGSDEITNLLEVIRGEDETDVTPDMGEELLELRILVENGAESTADHGVLAHDDDGLASESNTDLVHLVRTDIVNVDDEDGG